MERTYISELRNCIGKTVRVRGRVDTLRDQGKIVFLILRDITGKVQTVAWSGGDTQVFNTTKSLIPESVVDITGLVKEAKQVATGYEIEIQEIKIDSVSKTPLPIVIEQPYSKNISNLDKRLDYRWVDLRSERNNLMMRVATEMGKAFREFCINNGCTEIQGPRVISAASESGASVFEVKYFDRKAYLAQSPQFHKQMGIAADLDRVFNMGPVFRAEKSFTTRHLTEYTSFDVEIGYIDSFKDVCKFEQEMIKYALKSIKERYGEDIKRVFGIDIKVPEGDFPYITVKDIKEKLAKKGVPSKEEGDFSPEEERAISEIMEEETGSEFVFVHDYPHKNRAFYHMKDSSNPPFALGYDLFWKGIEITTGAQREHRLENLKDNAKERGISEESLKEYFEYFEYGCPPHGGFALGTERFMMKLLDFGSILETTYLPNTPNRLGKLINVKKAK
ncbi:aspartate--tRNA(Asn) ligase [Candidatus Dojkabacteria bacterium]|nr:aspartate--tRNA(Asn) ligase [Candidatus Dojkabacteria bacterium]